MALELKITAEIVDLADGGVGVVQLTDAHVAAAIAIHGSGSYDDAPAADVAKAIALSLAAAAVGGSPTVVQMRDGSPMWNLALEVLQITGEDAHRMGTEQLASDFSAAIATVGWRDFLRGRPSQRYDGGGKITLTEGSADVVGIGTTFLTAGARVIPGKHLLEVAGKRYGILAVPSDEALTLDAPYDEIGEVLSPRHYNIVPI